DYYPLMSPFAPLALAVRTLASGLSGTAPFTVTLTSRVVGGTTPYSYRWDFGDGTTSSSSNSTHIYSNAGSYTAKLVVADAAGGSDQNSLSIIVRASQPPPLNLGLVFGFVGVGGSVAAAGIAVFSKKRHRRVPIALTKSKRDKV